MKQYSYEIGALLLVTNTFAFNWMYTGNPVQDKMYFITTNVFELLILIGVGLKNKLVLLAICTTVARLLFNIFWAFNLTPLITDNPRWFILLTIIGSYLIINGNTNHHKVVESAKLFIRRILHIFGISKAHNKG